MTNNPALFHRHKRQYRERGPVVHHILHKIRNHRSLDITKCLEMDPRDFLLIRFRRFPDIHNLLHYPSYA